MKKIYIIGVEFFSYIESKITNSEFGQTENEKYFVNRGSILSSRLDSHFVLDCPCKMSGLNFFFDQSLEIHFVGCGFIFFIRRYRICFGPFPAKNFMDLPRSQLVSDSSTARERHLVDYYAAGMSGGDHGNGSELSIYDNEPMMLRVDEEETWRWSPHTILDIYLKIIK
jgi:hypothetical protein